MPTFAKHVITLDHHLARCCTPMRRRTQASSKAASGGLYLVRADNPGAYNITVYMPQFAGSGYSALRSRLSYFFQGQRSVATGNMSFATVLRRGGWRARCLHDVLAVLFVFGITDLLCRKRSERRRG
ncbi:hypothetical protein BaRGS_00021777 [Batillaria attramentaria]|uniref:Uncharacterized protein n=1 Tax=Batillaria attramentaria TaxID=370345 RepID=A0ABD0KIQ9_9CAEN